MWNKFKNLFRKESTENGPKIFYKNYNKNKKLLQKHFEKVGDLKIRELEITSKNGEKARCMMFYIQSLVEEDLIDDDLIKPLILEQRIANYDRLGKGKKLFENLPDKIISVNSIKKASEVEDAIEAILNGFTVLFVEGVADFYMIGTQGWKDRPIAPPEVERSVRGPKVAFIENLKINLGSIRRVIKSDKLKIEYFTIGEYTRTRVAVVYLEGIANTQIVKEVKKRLDSINVAQLNGCTHVMELIEDNPLSLFETIYETERVDVVTAGILEGRVSVVTDGCPTALLVPKLFMENFTSPEDYYNRHWYTLGIRILRFFGFLISTMLPAVYISILSFHQELLPLTLVRTVYASREGVPFPIVLEMLLFLFFFEAIKEAGARIPSSLGSAVSIVGALILGQAAIQAGFLSADGVIIGSITGISIFLIPIIEFNQSLLILRTIFILASAFIGFYGIALAIILVTGHLCSMRSFGVPITSPMAPLQLEDLKDYFVRVPYLLMHKRPESLETENKVRQGNRPVRRFFFKYNLDHDYKKENE